MLTENETKYRLKKHRKNEIGRNKTRRPKANQKERTFSRQQERDILKKKKKERSKSRGDIRK